MGTNYYTMDGIHIGKSSADGVWCWNCIERCTVEKLPDGLLEEVNESIRKSPSSDPEGIAIIHGIMAVRRTTFKCPVCGTVGMPGYNAADKELGFDSEVHSPNSIDSALRFTWQIGEYGLSDTIEGIHRKLMKRRKIKDEYGRVFTVREFLDIFKMVLNESTSSYEFS